MKATIDMAYEIIEMHERIQYLESQLAHYKQYEEKYIAELQHGIDHSSSLIGTVLDAIIDPESSLNKGLRARRILEAGVES